MAQLLDGIKVIECSCSIAGSYCTKLMADIGAEVIKVEEPGKGAELRSYGPFPNDVPHPEKSGLFSYLNTNKLGVTLNLKTLTGQQIFEKLIKQADILVETYVPRDAKELEIDYNHLVQLNPHLIVTSITPFGQTGPYCNYKGYALNTSALGGIASCIGLPDREPLAPPLAQSHFLSGSAGGVATIVALLARERHGEDGQHLDISESDCVAFFTGMMVHHFVYEGRKRVRAGHRTPGFYPYTILPCKDGYVSMIAILGRQWKSFLRLMGGGEEPDWYAKDPRFNDRWVNSLKYADELDARLSPWLMEYSMEEIFTMCQEKHIPFAPVRSIDKVASDSHFEEREYFAEVEHQEIGSIKFPGAPYKFSKTPWKIERPAPLLGEHNEEIYCRRLGYSKEDLVQLRRTEVV